ncbi:nitrate reductase subunit alpha [Trichlorobacter ammonificans]|uniref:nitrate reductase (quinone) n=1 Tax=Trichlorobacter ammonificans TaxID=2916410 RepID=A0ABM9DAU4_9BACT|nr:nitrate reductase subunit alpha [Trichlorobacter ammonificans]CAH2031493.1 nitrate reductase, alpha subunit [Trichlorobacter ammonificans]
MSTTRITDDHSLGARDWEEFYRNRWQYDKVVRSAHGVNCTGGCSWMVHVKDGIVGWELQANDYPQFNGELPNHEPRGCPRGISFSWYLYSPLRVKHPYMRGVLLDLWREARQRFDDPVEAWKSIVENPQARQSYTGSRGMGGFRRVAWETAQELIAASSLYTAKTYGPDRVVGFSPIPAMSMISYAAGSRFLQLFGGVAMSFYDWYCDLPPASPQVWGEQTDVNESADWYNASYIVLCGSNVPMTRTPDAHFLSEARYRGTKVVVMSPDYNMATKFADAWLPVEQGHDGAFWMALNHVLLTEFYVERQVPFFDEYVRNYTDLPFLVKLTEKDGALRQGEFLRASELERAEGLEHADWTMCVCDSAGSVRIPHGSIGSRYSKREGAWNLDMKDMVDGGEIDCSLSFLGGETGMVRFSFEADGDLLREVPVRRVMTRNGEVTVATVFDLLMAQFGVSRGLKGDYPAGYGDDKPFTPAWQEKYTGIAAETLLKIAREWGQNGEQSNGRNMVIIGAGINHWYHNDLIYRSIITALILTGSVGRNGAGLAHYVGQEKVVPLAPWTTVAMAQDWTKASRLQNTPSFWYIHSDQWRYDRTFVDYFKPETGENMPLHAADFNAKAVRLGWLPFAPHFNDNTLRLVEAAKAAGAATDDEIRAWLVARLKSGQTRFAIEDPDGAGNSPKVWFIWRGNAISSSAKGHEFFLKHVIGAPNSSFTAREAAKGQVHELVWHEQAPTAKMDLVVDLNFRMDTSTLYSDIVLPAATWYEKSDLNTTDMHSFVNCMDAAVPPAWESRTDWDIFGGIAAKVSELAPAHFPAPVRDIIAAPLLHDTPGEIAQRSVKDWKLGECEAIPGTTMPNLPIVERDYVNLYNRFLSLGPGIGHLHAHGVNFDAEDVHARLLKEMPTRSWGDKSFVDLQDTRTVADVLMAFAPETNGELAYRAYQNLEKRVGKPLAQIAAGDRNFRITWEEITQKPRRFISTPVWSGLVNDSRPYAPYTLNVEHGVPWRTLTGRQSFYLDHPYYGQFHEGLPTFKAKLDPAILDETEGESGLILNLLTPHGKWSIHSTYSDNLRMLTLSRGGPVVWLNHEDAASAGIEDNEPIEVYNANGVVTSRAVVSSRIPRGAAIMYHAPERTLDIRKSRKSGKRGGVHNSLSRIRLKPTLMLGGYAQFSYYFNYWGPTGVNRDSYVVVRKLRG